MAVRRSLLIGASALLLGTFAGGALAHHGWRWAEDGNFEFTGVIKAASSAIRTACSRSMPNGEEWTVEVGQPWRNERAGLTDGMLVPASSSPPRAPATPTTPRKCSRPSASSSTARPTLSTPSATEPGRPVCFAEVLSALQDVALVGALRHSHWVYPLVNAGHIVGLALLFGAIVPLDLRLLGLWQPVSIGVLARLLLPVAIGGLVLAALTGALLFSVSAVKYAGLTLFRVKLLLILAAAANALLLHRTATWRSHRAAELTGTTPRLQVAGALSLGLWLATIVAGRMLGYLD